MKKLCISILAISLFIITGCEEKKEKELEKNISETIKIDGEDEADLVCNSDYDYSDLDYVIGSKYIVFGDKKSVSKVSSVEIISSNDKKRLDSFEDYYNQNHDIAAKYNGYTSEVNRENKRIVSKVTIDYNEFDLKKFYEENETENKDDLTIDSIKKKYESLGATCKKK